MLITTYFAPLNMYTYYTKMNGIYILNSIVLLTEIRTPVQYYCIVHIAFCEKKIEKKLTVTRFGIQFNEWYHCNGYQIPHIQVKKSYKNIFLKKRKSPCQI
jgi:hypothetical protein